MSDISNKTDEELFAEYCQSQSEDALSELHRRHFTRLYRLARSYVGDAQASDAVQEAFLILVEKRPLITISFYNYMATIVRRWCYDRLKKETRCVPLNEPVDDVRVDDTDPLKRMLLKEDKDSIRKWFAALRQPYRQVIQLYYFADMPLRDIADCLGVSASNVHLWHYRAKQMLLESASRMEIDR